MIKKFILSICFILSFASTCFADICPSVDDIRGQRAIGWTAYDTESNQPLSEERLQQFKQSMVQFTMVEWADTTKDKGTMHCYYRDKDGSDMEAYLSKDNLTPSKMASKYWYQVSGASQCAASMAECEFGAIGKPAEAQLAKK